MKTIKIISTVIIVMLLLVAEGLVMGLFAIDRAVSEDSVRESMKESDIVARLVEEAIAESTVNMGGEYGEIAEAVFRTDAMNEFLGDYLAAAISTELYGTKYEEIADDELLRAFSQGIDEVNGSGAYSISPMEEELIKQAMQQAAPDLTATLNQQVGRYDSLDGENAGDALNRDLSETTVMKPVTKVILVLLCMGLCAALILLCWKSKLGFLWCCIVTALVSVIYMGMDALVSAMTFDSAVDHMMFLMAENGFGTVAAAGFVVAAAFLIAFIIFKLTGRRNKNEKDIETAERIA